MFEAFADLTYRRQVAQLRRLARAALAAYDLPESSFSLIAHWNNATFDVQSGAGRYILRVNRPGFQEPPHVYSELRWLLALCRDTALRVPEPVAARTGQYFTLAQTPQMRQPRTCVLFRRRPGRFYTSTFTPDRFATTGALMAQLHNHAASFKPSGDFTRKTWNADTALGNVPAIDQAAFRALISKKEADLYTAVRERYLETWDILGQSAGVYGLIHADLHQGNILYHKGEACPIDFDECGWGHYLHDVAVALMNVRHHRRYPEFKQAFFTGYHPHRNLADAQDRHLRAFTAGRLLGLAVWTAGVTDHPQNRSQAPGIVARTMRELEKLHL